MFVVNGFKFTAKCADTIYPKCTLPRMFNIMTSRLRSQEVFPPSNVSEPYIPPYEEKPNEPIEKKRARLLYQSRKRGMLENGLLLSTFAAKYLATMSTDMLKDYDRLINLPSNDWDLYYWASGVKETPSEFDTEVMKMLKKHVRNDDRQSRISQPDLY